MKYAHYDEKEKTLLGYYDDEIHDIIPTPNIEISDEDWTKALNENANSVDPKRKKLLRVEAEAKQDELAEINAQIKETEDYIRHAILIGNDSALPELRKEYKELLAQKQALEKGSENEKEN
nr:MAG TPA: hypothetical protein [Caudoviricetes sp.]